MQTKLQLQLGNALKVSKTIPVFSPGHSHSLSNSTENETLNFEENQSKVEKIIVLLHGRMGTDSLIREFYKCFQ